MSVFRLSGFGVPGNPESRTSEKTNKKEPQTFENTEPSNIRKPRWNDIIMINNKIMIDNIVMINDRIMINNKIVMKNIIMVNNIIIINNKIIIYNKIMIISQTIMRGLLPPAKQHQAEDQALEDAEEEAEIFEAEVIP